MFVQEPVDMYHPPRPNRLILIMKRIPPRVWDDTDREAARRGIQTTIAGHDSRVVPLIREMRPQQGWRAIARRLDMDGIDPPGSRYRNRPGEQVDLNWSHVAVRRIAQRHGIG